MEELALSHVLNAEGEKLQYVLGTIDGESGLSAPATVDELLDVNKSIRQTLTGATRYQMLLSNKLESAISTPTMQGPPGEQGPEGAQGSPGIQGPRGPEGPTGAQGLPGPKGDQGQQGIQGVPGENGFSGITVRGNYDPAVKYNINDYVVSDQGHGFVASVNAPTGPPPDVFESNDEWTAFVAAGAPGKQGIQGPQGQPGIPGPQGPRGAEGATGQKGETGAQGPKGDPGPEASSYTIIPFSSQMGPRTYANGGNPTRVTLLGFGYFDTSNSAIFIPDTAIPLNADGSFNLTFANSASNRQVVFSLPFDMTINSVYATVGNYGSFSPAGSVYPYIQLYSADAGSNYFTPLTDAAAIPTQGIGPGLFLPADIMRPASKDGLNIQLLAGTRIAIGGLMKITGDTGVRDYYLYFTGGVGMTRWFR